MNAEPELVVLPTASELATEVAGRLLVALGEAQRAHGRSALALTAGSIMERVWHQVAASGTGAALDWSAVDVFWGDERFVPSGSEDRNDAPAESMLFGRAPFSAAQRYSMPATDGPCGDDLDAAARYYAEQLAQARRPDDPDRQPAFDVVLLGVGPDGHCASLFPHHPGLADRSSTVIPVRNSPKPPPNRLSLSYDGLNTAREIWVVASGGEKASAVARALGGASPDEVPSAGARGRSRTLWLVDAEAAASVESSAR